jgi:hypothetical protein
MENKKNLVPESYDLTQNIKNVEVNTGFILGLERIILYFITDLIEDKTTIPGMFKKFESLLSQNKEESESVNLNLFESHVYTLFALQQLLRSHAYEQNLVSKVETDVNNEEIESLMEAFKTNDSAKIKELYQKLGKPSS